MSKTFRPNLIGLLNLGSLNVKIGFPEKGRILQEAAYTHLELQAQERVF